MHRNGTLFIADTYVNEDPTAQELADIAWMSVQEVQRFGLPPKVAFLAFELRFVQTPWPARCVKRATCSWRPTPRSNATVNCVGDAALEPGIRNAYMAIPRSAARPTC